ncbi:MAG: hypothetical protein Q4B36_02195 [Tissierellia bacterium]|nr:hypothetical protein [Tissierellia bacterium]
MYFIKTCKKFFVNDGSYDIYGFLFGLIFIFSFALISIKEWLWLISFSIDILLSTIFRYITTDEEYNYELKTFDKPSNIIDYILSKNLFAILFTSLIIIIVFIILEILSSLDLTTKVSVDLKIIITQMFFVLGTENIIIIFFDKAVKSYNSGSKIDIYEYVSIGIENFKGIIPTLISNIIFLLIFFYFKIDISIIVATVYFIGCILVFVFYKSRYLFINKK